MYTQIEEAVYFMMKAYKGQKRKNDNIDKSFHSMAVYMTMKDITNIEDVLIASILHNIIDDTEFGYEEIEEKFGTLVADMVSDLSEDMSIAKWFTRKKDFIKRMKSVNDVNVINIMIADKLQDLLSGYKMFKKVGDKIWKSTSGTKTEQCFIYRESYNIAKSKNANQNLLDRYKKLLKIYFGDFDE